uniref:myosin catalytic light chain, smooth muscle-like n=1 Tax=Styela clava TaxID=7725 RepID=UPI00193AB7F4|nr:myosin catalytic light chain, smooth muscle-like [Styela clava]
MEFTEQQIEDVREAYELFSDSDGETIYYHQVGDVIRALGECPTNEDVMKYMGNPSQEELKTKKMTVEEFLPVLSQIQKLAKQGSYEDFVEGLRVFDKDGNGTLRGAEIRHILTTLGERMSTSEVATMMHGQEDSSGTINYSDFSKFLLEKKI